MTSINLRFRASSIAGALGSLFFRVVHERRSCNIAIPYSIYAHEWSVQRNCILVDSPCSERGCFLLQLMSRLEVEHWRLLQVVEHLSLQGRFTVEQVRDAYLHPMADVKLKDFVEGVVSERRRARKWRMAEVYACVYRRFFRFLPDAELMMSALTPNLLKRYEQCLRADGLSANSVSFYLRNLRALFRSAVMKGEVVCADPFKDCFTGQVATRKRALTFEQIQQLRELDLSAFPKLVFARDLFLFSLFTRGMSMVDMAYLRKTDLHAGVLTYKRRKTGQLFQVAWEPCMQNFVDRYPSAADSPYLLPILTPSTLIEERRQYISAGNHINERLRELGCMLGFQSRLTLYVARHSWATLAKFCHVPLSIISQGLGHASERTTRIYLASFCQETIDEANLEVLRHLALA